MFRKKPKGDKIAWHYRQCVDHFGIGVIFSAASVFVYQGLITLTASFLGQFLVPDVVSQMSAIGGLLILAIGIGLLEIKKIKVGNILPAIFIPLIYQVLKHFYDVL